MSSQTYEEDSSCEPTISKTISVEKEDEISVIPISIYSEIPEYISIALGMCEWVEQDPEFNVCWLNGIQFLDNIYSNHHSSEEWLEFYSTQIWSKDANLQYNSDMNISTEMKFYRSISHLIAFRKELASTFGDDRDIAEKKLKYLTTHALSVISNINYSLFSNNYQKCLFAELLILSANVVEYFGDCCDCNSDIAEFLCYATSMMIKVFEIINNCQQRNYNILYDFGLNICQALCSNSDISEYQTRFVPCLASFMIIVLVDRYDVKCSLISICNSLRTDINTESEISSIEDLAYPWNSSQNICEFLIFCREFNAILVGNQWSKKIIVNFQSNMNCIPVEFIRVLNDNQILFNNGNGIKSYNVSFPTVPMFNMSKSFNLMNILDAFSDLVRQYLVSDDSCSDDMESDHDIEYDYSEYSRIIDTTFIKIAIKQLSHSTIELQLKGLQKFDHAIKCIERNEINYNSNETSVHIPPYSYHPYFGSFQCKWYSIRRLSNLMSNKNIIQIIFGATDIHTKKLKQATKIISVMAQENAISKTELALIWKQCRNAHDSQTDAYHNIIMQLASNLSMEYAQYLYDLMLDSYQNNNHNQRNHRLLDLISNFTAHAVRHLYPTNVSNDYWFGLPFISEMALNSEGRSLCPLIINLLTQTQFQGELEKYLMIYASNLKSHVQVSNSLFIFSRICLEILFGIKNDDCKQKEFEKFMETVANDHNLLQLIFIDIQHLLDIQLPSETMQTKEIECRLNFIDFLLRFCGQMFGEDHKIQWLWDTLIMNHGLSVKDRNIAIDFFKNAIESNIDRIDNHLYDGIGNNELSMHRFALFDDKILEYVFYILCKQLKMESLPELYLTEAYFHFLCIKNGKLAKNQSGTNIEYQLCNHEIDIDWLWDVFLYTDIQQIQQECQLMLKNICTQFNSNCKTLNISVLYHRLTSKCMNTLNETFGRGLLLLTDIINHSISISEGISRSAKSNFDAFYISVKILSNNNMIVGSLPIFNYVLLDDQKVSDLYKFIDVDLLKYMMEYNIKGLIFDGKSVKNSEKKVTEIFFQHGTYDMNLFIGDIEEKKKGLKPLQLMVGLHRMDTHGFTDNPALKCLSQALNSYFDELFDYLANENSIIANAVWTLLRKLPLDSNLVTRLETFALDWQLMFKLEYKSTSNILIINYHLDILCHLLNTSASTFIPLFVQHSGIIHICQLFLAIEDCRPTHYRRCCSMIVFILSNILQNSSSAQAIVEQTDTRNVLFSVQILHKFSQFILFLASNDSVCTCALVEYSFIIFTFLFEHEIMFEDDDEHPSLVTYFVNKKIEDFLRCLLHTNDTIVKTTIANELIFISHNVHTMYV